VCAIQEGSERDTKVRASVVSRGWRGWYSEHLSNCEPLHNLAGRHNVCVTILVFRFSLATKAAAERFVAPVRVPRRRERRTVCSGQRAVLYATPAFSPSSQIN